MTNRPKAIGTAAETAVRKALLRFGFTELEAHRNVLAGSGDKGDVWVRHPERGLIVFEVKGGKAAETAGPKQVQGWLMETEKEQYAANAEFGFLVRKKAGVGLARAEDWVAYLDLIDLVKLGGGEAEEAVRWQTNVIMSLPLSDLLRLIRKPARVPQEA